MPQSSQGIAIGLLIGLGLGYGYAIRWAGNHLRQRLRDQADAIHVEYAKDRQLMADCLRAAGALPFEKSAEGRHSQ